MEAYAGRQYVGIDLHRRRTVIVRTTEAGEVLEAVRIVNDVQRLASVMARAGDCPEVVLEATYGWYWAVDALQAGGANVHLAHPLGVKAFEYRRVKNGSSGMNVGAETACGRRSRCAAGVVDLRGGSLICTRYPAVPRRCQQGPSEGLVG